MADAFWLALALVLVIEGLLPMINPAAWRRVFEQALQLDDAQLRLVGISSVLCGLLLIWLLG
ncbi:DUF2065 family protein [Aquabacterium soli]|jgi:uncharacterized protein|uniref:DUF2065 family protein n=1 Tax=Aquabacterium soli TaxID=2493092 RepID=A0A3R8U3Y9_9BURK|nr:DUF2065 family protein [Aquabacterium soli]RRS04199.1 DUF2065 family protein [Aquabacterium soli]